MPDIVADNNGIVEGSLTIPEMTIPTGTVQVEVEGDQGSYGSTTYTSRGTITVEERRIVNTVKYAYDPLAQTFTLSEPRHIAGVDLWFTNEGSVRTVVQIRDTIVGFPSKNILAQGYAYPNNIKTDGTSTRILFDSPIYLPSGEEFSLVVLTDDSETALSVAELGKIDSSKNQWVTSQAYQTGVLLSSSNASTWSAHQNLDLTFRLLACKFTEPNYVVDLGSLTADKATDILTKAVIERTSSSTDVAFSYTTEDGTEHVLSEDTPVALPDFIDGRVVVKAKLKGDTKNSPVLYPGVQSVIGKIQETGDYVTRSISAGTNVRININYECYMPGSSDIKIYILNPDMNWNLVLASKTTPVGDNWIERSHVVEDFSNATTKIKIVLTGNTQYRPMVRNLKVIIT